MKYMKNLHETEETRFILKTIAAFSAIFRDNHKANVQKARNWWNKRDTTVPEEDSEQPRVLKSVVKVQRGVEMRMRLKPLPGRGPKRAPWVEWVYRFLLG